MTLTGIALARPRAGASHHRVVRQRSPLCTEQKLQRRSKPHHNSAACNAFHNSVIRPHPCHCRFGATDHYSSDQLSRTQLVNLKHTHTYVDPPALHLGQKSIPLTTLPAVLCFALLFFSLLCTHTHPSPKCHLEF